MNKTKWKVLTFWGCSIILLDQITKYLITLQLPLGAKYELISNFVDIVHYRNPGAAFGMFADWNSPAREIFFFGISILAIGFLIYYLYKLPASEKKMNLPLLLILAGAFSNLIDRIVRGRVVDFILLHWYDKVVSFEFFGKFYSIELVWPAFNVADSCITIGVAWLIFHSLFVKREVLE
jgi:signal peptidase II